MIITIDGPVASGKTTAGRNLAKQLGFYYLYSGLLYRALAYLLVQHCLYQDDELDNPKAEDVNVYLDQKRFIYRYDDQFEERIYFDTQDITPHLKTSAIDSAASILSANKLVRDAITALQRELARHFDIVIDGRDAGSVVFPGADVKFFLTASVEERAKRWQNQQATQGLDFTIDEAIKKISTRDKRDKERDIAPLVVPDNAIVVDNSELTQGQTYNKMLEYMQKVGGLKS